MFDRFSHVMMFVGELERAVAWYTGKLGFAVNFVAPGAYASLRHEAMGFRLDLHPSEADGRDVGFGPMPNFAVADLDRALAELEARGVKVSPPRRQGDSPRFATIWDSEGNALGLEESGR